MIKIDLEIVKGDTFPYNFVYKYRDGSPVDLTNFEVYGLIRKSETDETVLDEWTVDNGKIQVFPKLGRVRIILSGAQTMYTFNRAVWALVVKHKTSNFDKTLTKGDVLVIPGGSRWRRS